VRKEKNKTRRTKEVASAEKDSKKHSSLAKGVGKNREKGATENQS